jgi:hypothetical protein
LGKRLSRVSFIFIGPTVSPTALLVNLTEVSNRTATFTLFYWDQFRSRDITVNQVRTIDAATGLYVYSFIISNNEKVCAYVPRIGVTELGRGEANVTQARVYVNGSLFPNADVNGDGFYPLQYVDSGQTKNITITFPIKQLSA